MGGFDAPHRLSFAERLALAKWFRSLSSIAPVLLVRGNHDSIGDISVFSQVGLENPVSVITTVSHLEFSGVNFIFLPYITLPEVDNSLAKLPPSEAQLEAVKILSGWVNELSMPGVPNILLGHHLIDGSEAGSFEIKSVKDIVLNKQFFTNIGDNVKLSYFGHIHQKQSFPYPTNPSYLGSPWQTDHGEKLINKGVTILDINDDGSCSEKMVPLPDHFRLRTINGEWVDDDLVIPEESRLFVTNRAMCDNTRFRFKIKVSDNINPYSLKLNIWQKLIMVNGGYLDASDIHIVRDANISSIKIDRISVASPQKSMVALIKKKYSDPVPYLSRLEELSKDAGVGLWISTS